MFRTVQSAAVVAPGPQTGSLNVTVMTSPETVNDWNVGPDTSVYVKVKPLDGPEPAFETVTVLAPSVFAGASAVIEVAPQLRTVALTPPNEAVGNAGVQIK